MNRTERFIPDIPAPYRAYHRAWAAVIFPLLEMGETPMKINVRWSDILRGKSARTTECMVALALKRELGVEYASVGGKEGSILAEGGLVRLYLPQEVRTRIKFWDRFHLVLPFSFELATTGFLSGRTLEPALVPVTRRM